MKTANYKISPIKEGGCGHEMFGVSCKRYGEIIHQMSNIVSILEKVQDNKKQGIENLVRESLKIAQNNQESIYIAFFLGERIGIVGARKSSLERLAEGVQKLK